MVRELLEKIMIRHSAEGKISSSATKREENVIKDVEEEKNSANISGKKQKRERERAR
jgi:hypothetical protein